jgi:SAM-dependent methyltransferase
MSADARQLDLRVFAATRYLSGQGVEIGALNAPLALPPSLSVRYVDRMPVSELRRQYPELKGTELVEPDLLDDGERLSKLADQSQDFVIANHFLEHCENPILAVINMFRVLRTGGTLYLAIPDMRYTFDRHRRVTPIEHLVQDFQRGPEQSRVQHFEEFARTFQPEAAEPELQHPLPRLDPDGDPRASRGSAAWPRPPVRGRVRCAQRRRVSGRSAQDRRVAGRSDARDAREWRFPASLPP